MYKSLHFGKLANTIGYISDKYKINKKIGRCIEYIYLLCQAKFTSKQILMMMTKMMVTNKYNKNLSASFLNKMPSIEFN